MITAVAEAPGGSRPSYSLGITDRDNDFYKFWDKMSRDRDQFTEWMNENVLGLAKRSSVTATTTEVTAGEIQTIVAARRLRHTKTVFIGVGRPSTAAILARMVHNPELILVYESGTIGAKPFHIPLSIGDGELAETADSIVSVPEMFNYWIGAGRIDVAFLGAAQIDRHANLNSTVIGDYEHPKTRLPGAGGAPEIAASCGEVIVIAPHAKRTFVEKLDFVTTVGHGDGPGARERLGFRGRGPTAVITDLGVLEPEPGTCELDADRDPSWRRGRQGARGDRLGAAGRRRPADHRAPDRRGALSAPGAARPVSTAYVLDAVRAPFGRYGGGLSHVRPDDLGAHVVRALLDRAPELDPERVDEVLFGDANQAGEDNRNVARMAWLLNGLPTTVPGSTVNRLCGSSLDAAMQASRMIETGEADVVLVGGVESMSRAPWILLKPERAFPAQQQELYSSTLGWRMVNPNMPDQWTISLGESAEKLAGIYNIIARGPGRVRAAQPPARAGRLGERLLRRVGRAGARTPSSSATRTSGPTPRSRSSAKLKPAFVQDGTVTAGNSSPLNDGAGAALVASEEGAKARRPGADRPDRVARGGGGRSRRVRDRAGQGREHRARARGHHLGGRRRCRAERGVCLAMPGRHRRMEGARP